MGTTVKNNPFEYHETDYYVACVGVNGGTDNSDIREGFKKSVHYLITAIKEGATEDILIYPIVYNARHSIELSLKLIIEKIYRICEIKGQMVNDQDKKIFIHDINELDKIVKKYYEVDTRIVALYDSANAYLVDYFFDVDGDAFKYETDHDGNFHMIKHGISSISIDILEDNFNKLMVLFDDLIFDLCFIVDEYKIGTFTKNLSRKNIRDIAITLPERDQWVKKDFKEIKEKIKVDYGISSNELSEVLNIIQNHIEFCSFIGMEKVIENIPVSELEDYANMVLEMKKYHKRDQSIKPMSKESLKYIQEKTKFMKNISKNISHDTITFLMTFREFGRSTELYSEQFERIHTYMKNLSLNRLDSLKKLGKIDIFNRVILGLKKCGQKSYLKVLEDITQSEMGQ